MGAYQQGGAYQPHQTPEEAAYAGYSSYNDASQPPGHSTSPREYLHTPVYSPPGAYNQQGFSTPNTAVGPYHQSAAPSQQGFYANQHPESGATMLGARNSMDSQAKGSLLAGDEAEKASPAKRRKRRCCGNGRYCWCFSKKCCCIFIPILILILAGLGVTLYYVWPRIPEVEFDRVSVVSKEGNSREGSVDQLLNGGVTINRNGVVTVPLVIHLNVTNPNFIPWTIHNVTVEGFLANSTNSDNDFPVGEGGLIEPFKMPKKSVENDMPMHFNFHLDTNNTSYLPAAETVQKSCSPGGPDLRFRYKAKVILRAISWLGIKPTISDTINFACPISDIENLGITISDLTGLSQQEIDGIL
ncbi:hypothetical protein H4R24_004067 [Coemansia sp. RSA 988]|nr:hypothetical protein H4R24_004067 [Coemansia sp. RSA 988]